jgi:hypothetical protein
MTPSLNLPAPGRCQTLYVVLTTLQSPVFLLNSRLALFTATSFSSSRRGFTYLRHSLSRSYGVNLPSSLATVHSSTLGFSPHLPVSVYGTVCLHSPIRGFSWQHGYGQLWPIRAPCSRLGVKKRRICLPLPPTRLNHLNRQVADLSLLRHPL